jgi:hypothetical protein
MFKHAMILCLLLLLTGCSLKSPEAPYEDVDKAAILFFERLSTGKYDEIYSDSEKTFQSRNPRPEVIENLKKMSMMGKPGSPVRMTMTYSTEEGKRVAMPNYAVLFDNNNPVVLPPPGEPAPPPFIKATVILKFIDDSGEWKLGAFEVRQRAG